MRVKIMGYFVCLPMLMLGLVEFGASLVAYSVATRLFLPHWTNVPFLCPESLIFAGSISAAMIAMSLYCQRLRNQLSGIMKRVSVALVVGGLVARLLSLIFLDHWFPAPALAGTVMLAWLQMLGTRWMSDHLQDGRLFKRRVLVIGSGRRAGKILQLRRRSDRRGFFVTGYVAVEGEIPVVPKERIIGWPDDLLAYARRHGIREIVVAMDDRRRHFPFRELLNCRLAGVHVCELGLFLERETGKLFLDNLNPSWLIFGSGFRQGWFRRGAGRAFDLIVSAVLLIFGAPLMLLVVLAIKIEEGWRAPVLYRQDRVGQYGQIFKVIKFRSMRMDAEADGRERWAEKNDSRVTKVGGFIRKVRLDELPQLINVLRGAMSFVGPRPERPAFVAKFDETIPYYVERHTVKPGITGWAQLCYPYGASEKDAMEKLQYDLFYVKNRGLMFDILIILQTLEVIVFGRGAR